MADSETNHLSVVFSLSKYLSLLWHYAWLICLAALFAGIIAFGISKIIPPVYEATTTVMINGQSVNEVISYSSMEMNVQLAQTYAQMMTQPTVLQEVQNRLKIDEIDPKTITAVSLTNMPLITLTVKARDPQLAALIANTLVLVFRDQQDTLQTQRFLETENNILTQINETETNISNTNHQLAGPLLASDRELLKAKLANYEETYTNLLASYEEVKSTISSSTTGIYQVEPASAPNKPISPKPLENTSIAFLVGLVLAASAVYVMGINDTTLKDPEEISAVLGQPVIGTISHYFAPPNFEKDPDSSTIEEFRGLRTNIHLITAGWGKPIQTLLVISPSAGEGKTTIAINLCKAIALNDQKICLIDANLRQPKIHNLMTLPQSLGLSDALKISKTKIEKSDYLQATKIKKLQVVTSGEIPQNPAELLDSANFSELITQIKTRGTMIVIDTPPALSVADAFTLLPYVDGVLLVMKAGTTKQEQAVKLIKDLKQVNASILGIVVNDLSNPRMVDQTVHPSTIFGLVKGEGRDIFHDLFKSFRKIPSTVQKSFPSKKNNGAAAAEGTENISEISLHLPGR